MGNVIKEWVKDGCGKYKGVFIAYKKTPTFFCTEPPDFSVGFSFCHAEDTFCKETALIKAFERAGYLSNAKNVNKIYHKIPPDYRIDFYVFLKRCIKYFKDANYTPYWILGLMLKIEKEYKISY